MKHFFMSVLQATLQGRPQVRFNVISMSDNRNIGALELTKIQTTGAHTMQGEEVNFDNLVIDNIFYLGEFESNEAFARGTELPEQKQEAEPTEQVDTADVKPDAEAN